MRTLWLNINGTEAERQRQGIAALDYPLCFNLPRPAWREGGGPIALNAGVARFALCLDVLVELDAPLRGRPATPADVRACRVCAGLEDTGLADALVAPSVRDLGVAQYYARFGQHANLVGPPLPPAAALAPEALGLTAQCDGQPQAVSTAVRLGALDVLSFLGTFTTLHPGDLVSLGTLWRREFPARGAVALDASWPGGSLAVRVEP
ncbi:hypothetical protein [Desulfocurvus vexinensis]|uniref:hypothetical protein n=1 Tax=Desulfocurvus vexinensis TaxID=399548 RepID=UPI00048A4A89|nr:hypothetical protein [Desulfocurvus vexinensis]